jgi:hypothetical protein
VKNLPGSDETQRHFRYGGGLVIFECTVIAGVVMSATSKARRAAHRALGRTVKEGKADEASAAAYKAVEEKRTAKLKKK